MARKRAGTHAIRIEGEATFGTIPASFPTNADPIQAWGISVSNKQSEFPNEAVMTDLGQHETGYGPSHDENELTFSTYMEGLGTAAASTVQAIATAFTTLHEISLGGTVNLSTGATVEPTATAGAPNSTVLVESTINGNQTANSLVCFLDASSDPHVRPVSTISGTDGMTLLMELPAIPADSSVIYGGAGVQFAEQTTQTGYYEAIGKSTASGDDDHEGTGCVATFGWAEVNGNQPQTLSWTVKSGDFVEDGSVTSSTQVAPTNARPIALAGGDFLIAAYGSSAVSNIDLSGSAFTLNREWSADEAPNEQDNIEGWTCLNCPAELTIFMKPTAATPTGITASTYRAAWISGGSETLYHMLFQFGRVVGNVVAYYFPRMRMSKKPERVERNGKTAQKLTFVFAQGANSTATGFVWMRQF